METSAKYKRIFKGLAGLTIVLSVGWIVRILWDALLPVAASAESAFDLVFMFTIIPFMMFPGI